MTMGRLQNHQMSLDRATSPCPAPVSSGGKKSGNFLSRMVQHASPKSVDDRKKCDGRNASQRSLLSPVPPPRPTSSRMSGNSSANPATSRDRKNHAGRIGRRTSQNGFLSPPRPSSNRMSSRSIDADSCPSIASDRESIGGGSTGRRSVQSSLLSPRRPASRRMSFLSVGADSCPSVASDRESIGVGSDRESIGGGSRRSVQSGFLSPPRPASSRRVIAKSARVPTQPAMKVPRFSSSPPIVCSDKATTYRHLAQGNKITLYEWQQTANIVTIFYPSPSPKTKVFGKFQKNHLQLGGESGGLPTTWFLTHATGGLIDASKSNFKRDKEKCTIYLVKAHPGAIWSSALQDDRVDNIKTVKRSNNVTKRSQGDQEALRHHGISSPNAFETPLTNGRKKKRAPKTMGEKAFEMPFNSPAREDPARKIKPKAKELFQKLVKNSGNKVSSGRDCSKNDKHSNNAPKPRRKEKTSKPRKREKTSSSQARPEKERSKPKSSSIIEKQPLIVEVEQEEEKEKKSRSKLPSVKPPQFIYVEMTTEEERTNTYITPLDGDGIRVKAFSDDISVLKDPKISPLPMVQRRRSSSGILVETVTESDSDDDDYSDMTSSLRGTHAEAPIATKNGELPVETVTESDSDNDFSAMDMMGGDDDTVSYDRSILVETVGESDSDASVMENVAVNDIG